MAQTTKRFQQALTLLQENTTPLRPDFPPARAPFLVFDGQNSWPLHADPSHRTDGNATRSTEASVADILNCRPTRYGQIACWMMVIGKRPGVLMRSSVVFLGRTDPHQGPARNRAALTKTGVRSGQDTVAVRLGIGHVGSAYPDPVKATQRPGHPGHRFPAPPLPSADQAAGRWTARSPSWWTSTRS